jgi:hypothetical protein
MRARGLTPSERQERRRRALALNLAQHLDPARGRGWTADQLALLGTDSDEAVAAQIGRTPAAVRVKRNLLGIASACDRRKT